MDIKYICEFVHLAESCRFQETAAELYISQSSLTKHIHIVEQELGVQLFTRNTHKVSLNKYGKVFYPYAKQIIELFADSTNSIKYMTKQEEHSLNIGAPGYMNFYGLHEALADFTDQYPDCKYNVAEGKDPDFKKMLQSNEISFIFTSNIQQYPEFEHQLWKRDELVLIVPDTHPLAEYKTITIEHLANREVMVHGSPADYTTFISACKDCGFVPLINSRISFSSTIISLVARRQGISVINKKMLSDRDLGGISIIPIVPTLTFNIYLVYKDSQLLSNIEKAFLTFINNDKDFDASLENKESR